MNGTTVSEFILLGFRFPCPVQTYLSALVLACYAITLLGNCLILATVLSDPHLRNSPMYFFLANLSLTDMTFASVAAPKFAADLLKCGHSISYAGCMGQLFYLHFFGGAEMLLLSVMAYDRYVAICHPLRYGAIMDRQYCFKMLVVCWTGGFLHSTINAAVVAYLPFCGPNVLDNFYCELPQVIKLACMDIYAFEVITIVNSGLITLPCFLTLLVSYSTILTTVCNRFGKGGGKALSTCGSHLIVVSLFYVPCVIVYLKPFSNSQKNKVVSTFYMLVTPALNPFIYSLRNQEIKGAMRKLKHKCKRLLVPQRE